MDVLLLSRMQFAFATFIHFLFVPLTLGLSILIAIMETKYAKTGDEEYKKMAKFWGKIFLINFAVGVVTGITLEFQFGTNWSKYSAYVGDIFGSLLAVEATAAFFLESTFIAIWHFGWEKLSPKMHAACMWIISIASSFSAIWILIANSWMQNPVGYAIKNGRAELTNFLEVVTQQYAINEIIHTVAGAYILAGFVVMGISAYHILKKQNLELFKKSFKIALLFALIFSFVEVMAGHASGNLVAEVQPAKLAAMESHWETQKNAPMYMFLIPDEKKEKNNMEIIKIPGLLSLLAFNNPDSTVIGLKDIPKNERPPVLITFITFRIMVALGTLFIFITVLGWFLRNKLESNPLFLKLMILSIPLPYIALQAGWIVAEVGRQPWIVYGLMRTSEAVSPISQHQVLFSLIAFFVVYTIITIAAFFLMANVAMKGPKEELITEEGGK
ncbi:MAG: cytochrome ubiquinol oxidase subunit I [Vampirovibrionia bacterium]